MAENRFRAHSLPLALAYSRHFSDDPIHIRSSGYGISGAFYRTHGFPDEPVTPKYRAELASFLRCTDPNVIDAFDDLSRAMRFTEIAEHGYDPLDFQRWEYREGVWLQTTFQESDMTFDTAILLGSREIMRDLLSLPLQDRATYRHFLWLIRDCWPELLDIPVNGNDYSQVYIEDLYWDPTEVVKLQRPTHSAKKRS